MYNVYCIHLWFPVTALEKVSGLCVTYDSSHKHADVYLDQSDLYNSGWLTVLTDTTVALYYLHICALFQDSDQKKSGNYFFLE